MRARKLFASLVLAAACAAASAAEREPVTLSDGVTGMAEILSTQPDSLTVKFTQKGGAQVETTVSAKRLDPISFYEIRRRHMESTPENHVRLAVHCAENGMLHQARFQMESARAIDPDIDQKLKDRPEVMEAIAMRLVEAAKRAYAAGDLATAHDLVQVLATRFTETAAAAKAGEALDLLEKKIAERDAADVAARQKKVEEAKDAALRAEAERREAVVAALEKEQAAARKKESQALRERNTNNAKNGHEAAVAEYMKVIGAVDAAKTAAGSDTELVTMIAEVERKVRTECADALVNVGSMELARSNFDKAEAAGRKALEVDAGNSRAKSFLQSVDVARSQADEWRELQDARARRGGR